MAGFAVSVLLVVGCRIAPSDHPVRSSSNSENAGNSRQTERTSEAALEIRAAAHAHYAAGVIHDLNNETALALEEYCKAARNDPEDESLIMEVSGRLLENNQPQKALEVLLPAASGPNASGRIFARLGVAYLQLGQDKQAIEANRMAIKRSPRSLAGYQNLFLAFLQNKQPKDALRILDEAAKQPNADAEFLIGIGELYTNYMLQYPSQRETVRNSALTALAHAEKLEVTSPQLRLKLADGFFLLEDYQKASALYLKLVDQLNDFPFLREAVRARLADLYLRAQDRKHAMEQLEAIVRSDPSNAQAYYYLGSIAFDDKRWADAAEFLKQALLFSPDLEPAYYDLASAQIAEDRAADAMATLAAARGKFPQNFLNEFLTGIACSQQKDYTNAINHYTAAEVIAQTTEPERLTAAFYCQVGAAFEREGDRGSAEKYFQKSLELDPDDAEALNYLGYMWAEHGVNLDKARVLIERALKIEPKNGAYLDSMGWVLFKLNQPAEALDYVLKAVELIKKPEAILYDHLGDIYAALHQMDKAREAWQKSLALEPNGQIRQKLESNKPK